MDAAEQAVVAVEAAPPPVPAVTVPAVRDAFAVEYLTLLQSPGVKANIRKALATGSPKDVKEILSVLLPALLPSEKAGGSSGPTRITLVNKVTGGAGPKVVDVTPGRARE